MAQKDEELTFEEAMEQLEEIVSHLEKGDVPLEKALEHYKEGMKLSKLCSDKLTKVQDQMVQIMNDEDELEPFDAQEEN